MQAENTDDLAADDQAEAIDLRMPAWLVSALFHVLVVLALPLFDLPPFAHRFPTQLEVSTATDGEPAEVPITQVVLSLTLPDAPVGTIAETFAAKPPSPTAGGGSVPDFLVLDTQTKTMTTVCTLPASPVIDEGLNEFDPAGTRDITAARTDLTLQIPDKRLTQVPLLTPEDMTQSVASGPENEAIAAALCWIISRQRSNGSWDQLAGMMRMGRGHDGESRHVGPTALALLPLIALGQTHQSGRYQTQIQTAVEFLLMPDDDPVNRDAEAQRALALCELFLATRDPRVREAAATSMKRVLNTNYPSSNVTYAMSAFSGQRVTGGPPRRGTVASDWAWQIWAVYAAQLAGLQDDTNVLPTLRGHCSFRSQDGLVGRAYSTYDLSDSWLVAAADQVAATGPATQGERPRDNDYYATLLLARLKHPAAKKFQDQLTKHLLKQQLKLGPDLGSWKPEHSTDTPLTATIFSALILVAPSETTAIHKPRTTVP